MDKKIEKAINNFLKTYRKKKEYVGAILCGSYAVGNNDANSDIDMFVITSNDCEWRERGNKLIDGYLIEYFTNPIYKVEQYFDREIGDMHNATIRMFAQGIVLEDKNGEVLRLKNLAKKLIKTKAKEVSEYDLKMNLYSIWNAYDELENVYKKGIDIDLLYNNFIIQAFNSYCVISRTGGFPLTKLQRMLTDKEYRKNYGLNKFFNNDVVKLFKDCLQEKETEKQMICARNLYNYINEKYNFDINNFSLVSSAK